MGGGRWVNKLNSPLLSFSEQLSGKRVAQGGGGGGGGGDKDMKRGIYTLSEQLEGIKESVFFSRATSRARGGDSTSATTRRFSSAPSKAAFTFSHFFSICLKCFSFFPCLFSNLRSDSARHTFPLAAAGAAPSLHRGVLRPLALRGLFPGPVLPSRPGLRLKKKNITNSPDTFSGFLPSVLLFMWMASSVSQAQFWMVTLSL